MAFRKIVYVLLLFLLGTFGRISGQNSVPVYWIPFTDKDQHAQFSLQHPEEFLSARAIERRSRQGIALSPEDLPVDEVYIDSITGMGASLLNISKWFNGVTVAIDNEVLLSQISALSFVAGPPVLVKPPYSGKLKSASSKLEMCNDPIENGYGPSYDQVEMIGGDVLHAEGFQGQGVLIAILDAGFTGADQISSLQAVWQDKRVLATRDFVHDTLDIFNAHGHGTRVFSIIGGMEDGILHGTAPQADFLLIRTEEGAAEYLIEEYNWISGIEFADSMGADVVNSSLGYSLFLDSTQNHTYADMDGKTTPISKAAEMAAARGMIVVTSAGNEGSKDWRYITAPADANGILAVGATDSAGIITPFSSRGPSADGRVKPDVCAMGYRTISQHPEGYFTYCTGTSCSSPVLAGVVACLWQSLPNSHSTQIIRDIKRNSSMYIHPDGDYGYGIPNAIKTTYMRRVDEGILTEDPSGISLFPNPSGRDLYISLPTSSENETEEAIIQIYDLSGRMRRVEQQSLNGGLNILKIDDIGQLSRGVYLLRISFGEESRSIRFIKF